ncbi:type I pantothenate kinase [Corynebacterium auriscanis]|uniref:Pantothenate kinase n=1 Tax=Corynebacterium auriscanis TaxID=99807 RepID=A0A0A2DMC9_9CORY|nr:type I pantothenate kinase [Corynebacterium auriscanis]KGM18036.1 pantothenate kinase [Corynebacterium auriscanis]MCX2162370.1 type I pantothenate kinase [Corynebacterium auriscanis]WJY73174.1 Pantothenate kinase [Corynebacterium auriscanis]
MCPMSSPSPYIELDREQWRKLRKSMPQVLTEDELEQLRGIGDEIDLEEVSEVYLPLSRLINLRVQAHRRLNQVTETFLGEPVPPIPYIIGVSGSVAVGKSTTARVLQVLLQRWESSPNVDLVTTDGFLLPTAELERRRILHRKGFPESYDQAALLDFVTRVKSGTRNVKAPVYSHEAYDRIPGEYITVDAPDILILEGLNVLQTGPTLMVSDLFDFSVYVDARREDVEDWYIDRFLRLKNTAFKDPRAHFHHFAELTDEEATVIAREIWQTVNLPNLMENVLPTRVRASLVLRKGADHSVQKVRMRKI